MLKKKLFLIFGSLALIFAGNLAIFNNVLADNDRGREEENDDYRPAPVSTPDPTPAPVQQEQTTSTPEPKTYKQTVIVSPAQIVTEYQDRMVSFPDSDYDGIADVDDEYPEVADIYIVKDENGNGIVDTFENQNQ